MLFATKTGNALQEEKCGFVPISYLQLAEAVRKVRDKIAAEGRWGSESERPADRYAFYLVDAFLRHIELHFPDKDVRDAVKRLARGERPAGVSVSGCLRNQRSKPSRIGPKDLSTVGTSTR